MRALRRDDRTFRNDLPKDPPSPSRDAILTPQTIDTLRGERDRLARDVLAADLPAETDVYVGAAGVALMAAKLAWSGEVSSVGLHLEAITSAYLERHAPSLRARTTHEGRVITFLCGDIGPHIAAMALAAATRSGDDLRGPCADALAGLAKASERADSDELLYGRAGLLHGALLAGQIAGEPLLDEREALAVAERALDAGRRSGGDRLFYRWNRAEYLGAAHGYAGILFTLLHLPRIAAEHEQVLRGTLDFLAAMRLPSGNFPNTNDEPDEDRLVQWCHGAPGFVALFALAASVYHEPRYLKLAEGAARVTWERGLLRKGLGLCHGVAGNGYAFLSLYRATGDAAWLHKAVMFGLFCAGETGRSLHRVPEEPLSLYEGLAGAVCFLSDLLRPEASWMPGYELPARL